jgi:signal transduction histidine kinase
VVIEFQQEEPLVESVPPLSIRRMIENLINNSVQHGGNDNHISLQLETEKQFLRISVLDTGVGIDENKFDEVLKPFTRLNEARDTTSSNVGLGLSITASLAKAYGGRLTLENNPQGGLIATVTVFLS